MPPPSQGFASGWESQAGGCCSSGHGWGGGAEASQGPQCLGTAEREPQPGFNHRQPTSTGAARGAGGNGRPPLCCLHGKGESRLQQLVSNIKCIFLAYSCLLQNTLGITVTVPVHPISAEKEHF